MHLFPITWKLETVIDIPNGGKPLQRPSRHLPIRLLSSHRPVAEKIADNTNRRYYTDTGFCKFPELPHEDIPIFSLWSLVPCQSSWIICRESTDRSWRPTGLLFLSHFVHLNWNGHFHLPSDNVIADITVPLQSYLLFLQRWYTNSNLRSLTVLQEERNSTRISDYWQEVK